MRADFFRLSSTTKLIIVVALCLAAVSVIATTIYGYKHEIKSTIDHVVYTIKLPFRIGKMVSSPPDETLLMPVDGIKVSGVTDTWGAARSEGRKHEGQDIFADRGTKVYSATEGYVTYIGQNELGGNVVFVLGAGGRRYYYAHLDSFARSIKRLSRVDTNTILGYVGNTGNAETTPPHLHFGVYEGEAINPLPLLFDRPDS